MAWTVTTVAVPVGAATTTLGAAATGAVHFVLGFEISTLVITGSFTFGTGAGPTALTTDMPIGAVGGASGHPGRLSLFATGDRFICKSVAGEALSVTTTGAGIWGGVITIGTSTP